MKKKLCDKIKQPSQPDHELDRGFFGEKIETGICEVVRQVHIGLN